MRWVGREEESKAGRCGGWARWRNVKLGGGVGGLGGGMVRISSTHTHAAICVRHHSHLGKAKSDF